MCAIHLRDSTFVSTTSSRARQEFAACLSGAQLIELGHTATLLQCKSLAEVVGIKARWQRRRTASLRGCAMPFLCAARRNQFRECVCVFACFNRGGRFSRSLQAVHRKQPSLLTLDCLRRFRPSIPMLLRTFCSCIHGARKHLPRRLVASPSVGKLHDDPFDEVHNTYWMVREAGQPKGKQFKS